MKTNLFFTIGSVLTAWIAIAQPVIQMADVTPQMGSIIETTAAEYFHQGTAGADQLWDFSDMVFTASIRNEQVVSPEETVGGANYVGATHALKGVEGFPFVNYFSLTNDAVQYMGNASTISNNATIASNPRTEMQFPLSYNATFVDDFVLERIQGNNTYVSEGTQNGIVDGYGTLITPAGTFTDVLRVKTISEGTMTHFIGNDIISSNPFSSTQFQYVKAGLPMAIASFLQDDFIGNYFSGITMSTDGGLNTISSMALYPSPASSFLEARIDVSVNSSVTYRLFGLDGRLVEQWAGRQLYHGSNNERFELPSLANGLYVFQIATPEQVLSQKLMVAQ